MEGIINLLKPPGMTSHDAVSFLRRTLGEKKIGHCGTLDPQAAGVLPVCLGQATRLADYVSGGEKSYYAEMRLGYETDTQDIWGKTIWISPEGKDGPFADPEKLKAAFRSLEGEIIQEVPAYSAVKRGGKSLYQYAREGNPYTGITRKAMIRSIRLIGGDGEEPALPEPERIRFCVECGGGTYVRMLCRDLGRRLGGGGVMSFLLRTKVGSFRLEDSVTLEEIQTRKEGGGYGDLIAPKELALARMPRATVNRQCAEKIRHGQSLWLHEIDITYADPPPEGAETSLIRDAGHKIWVADEGMRLAAVGCCQPGGLSRKGQVLFKPDKVFTE